jgi:sensor histidine kinase YesM
MMSYILYECAQPRVPVYKDLEFIENYIDLQRLRLSPNITLETSLPAETDSSLTIEPMLMIPFIENAFKHGLSTRQPHTISISVGIKDKIINMSVINPLIRKADEIDDDKKHRGIGIANTRQRLEHSYPHAFRLQIGEMDGKHVVTLDIQLEKS